MSVVLIRIRGSGLGSIGGADALRFLLFNVSKARNARSFRSHPRRRMGALVFRRFIFFERSQQWRNSTGAFARIECCEAEGCSVCACGLGPANRRESGFRSSRVGECCQEKAYGCAIGGNGVCSSPVATRSRAQALLPIARRYPRRALLPQRRHARRSPSCAAAGSAAGCGGVAGGYAHGLRSSRIVFLGQCDGRAAVHSGELLGDDVRRRRRGRRRDCG